MSAIDLIKSEWGKLIGAISLTTIVSYLGKLLADDFAHKRKVKREQGIRKTEEQERESTRIAAQWLVYRKCEGRICKGTVEWPEWFFHNRGVERRAVETYPTQRHCRACRSTHGTLGRLHPASGESEAEFEARMAPFY